VHLMHTQAPWEHFDLIITTPQYRLPERPNILHNTAPLTRVDPQRLAAAVADWAPRLAHLPRPFTALLVGGNSSTFLLDAVTLVLVRSESLRRTLVDLGCNPEKIEIQRTGIPLEEFPFRQRVLPSNGEWHFVQAGRLIEKKGLPITIRAFEVFVRQYPNATLRIAGEGPLLRELEMLARELKIAKRVSFTGFLSQEQLREIYYRSHIFLHPSQIGRDGNQEGIPNSMLEAMATGLPVFATEHGGIPEAVEDGVSGVLVPERDEFALVETLLNAVQDPDLLSRIAHAGANAVRKKFDLQEQAQRLDEIYLRLL